MKTSYKRPIAVFVIVLAFVFTFMTNHKNALVNSKSMKVMSEGGGGENSSEQNPKPGDPTYETWCHELADNTIYTLGSKLNCADNSQSFFMGLMIAVFLTVCIEIAVHSLDHHVKNFVTMEIINKVYRELMMLGFISFGINVLESVHLFELVFRVLNDDTVEESPHETTERRVKIFELVHVCLFVLSIVYVVAVVISYFICKRMWKKWNSFEEIEKKERGSIMRNYMKLKERLTNSNILLKVLNVKLLYDYFVAVERWNYFVVKQRFIAVNKLPSTFRFDIYLKARIRKLFLHIIDIGVEVWAVIFVGALINYARDKVIDIQSGGSGLWTFFGFLGILPLAICILLYFITRLCYGIYLRMNTTKVQQFSAISSISDLNSNLLDDNNEQTQQDERQGEVDYPEPTHESLHHVDYDISMSTYLPFHLPKLIYYGLQGILVAHSFYIAMLIVHFLNVCLNEDAISNHKWLNLGVYLLLYTPTLVVLFIFFPYTMAPYTLLTSVENFSSHKTILYTVSRTHALSVRSKINHIMHTQPEYHPFKERMRKQLTSLFPALSEDDEFRHGSYFSHDTHTNKKNRKLLLNLIKQWSSRDKNLKEAMFRASRRQSMLLSQRDDTDIGSLNTDDDGYVEFPETNVIV